MRVFIPELGTILILAEDWTFKIVNEQRNASLARVMGIAHPDYYCPWGTEENLVDEGQWAGRRRIPIDPGKYTFPAGTTLEVDRIYVRKGNEEFSSVTFKTRVKGRQIRFFAKLDDINRMEI